MTQQYKTIHGVDLDAKDDMVVLADKRDGTFEEQTFNYLEMVIDSLSHYYPKPLVFADIGAYTGIYSIYAAMQGLMVEAFEPNPAVYKRLQDNITHNDEKLGGWSLHITYHNCALSDSAGEAVLHHNNNVRLTSGGSLEIPSVVDINDPNQTMNKYAYKIVTDTYRNGVYRRPHIVKIDVEGHELSVLRGMECLHDIEGHKPVIIIEANHYDIYCEIMEYLTELNYEFVDMYDGRNMVFAPRMLQFINS